MGVNVDRTETQREIERAHKGWLKTVKIDDDARSDEANQDSSYVEFLYVDSKPLIREINRRLKSKSWVKKHLGGKHDESTHGPKKAPPQAQVLQRPSGVVDANTATQPPLDTEPQRPSVPLQGEKKIAPTYSGPAEQLTLFPKPDMKALLPADMPSDLKNLPWERASKIARANAAFRKLDFYDRAATEAFFQEHFSTKWPEDENGDSLAMTVTNGSESGVTGELSLNGEVIGKFERNWDLDSSGFSSRIVQHSTFKINDEYQNKGYGSLALGAMEDFYKAVGIEQIEVEANIDVGGYAWAALGFDFKDAEGWVSDYVYDSYDTYGDDYESYGYEDDESAYDEDQPPILDALQIFIDSEDVSESQASSLRSAVESIVVAVKEGYYANLTAYNFASLGLDGPVDSDGNHFGARLMLGTRWDGVKHLWGSWNRNSWE